MSSSLSPYLRDIQKSKEKVVPKSLKELEKLIKVTTQTDKQKLVWRAIKSLEERVETKIRLNVFRLLYQKEETVFGIINMIVNDVVGPGFTFIPDPDVSSELLETAKNEAKLVEIWARNKHIKLKRETAIGFRDALVYGRGFLEVCYNLSKNNILVIHSIDPEDMQFQTDPATREVLLDEWLNPVGYIYKEYISKKELKLNADEICHIKLFGLGEPSLGLSALEGLYNVLKAKMNIEEALAEAIFRRAFPWIIAYCGDPDHEPSIEEIDKVHQAISEIEKKTEFTFPYYIKIESLEPKGIAELEGYHNIYHNLVYEAFNVPRGLIRGGRRTEVERGNLRWERTVLNYQELLGEQIQEQVIDRYSEVKNFKTRPRLKWNILTPQHRALEVRGISTLYRHGALTRDLDSENYLRKMFGMPTKSEKDIVEEPKIEERIIDIIVKEVEKRISERDE